MNKLKIFGLLALSILMTACATTNQNQPEKIKINITSYNIKLSRDVIVKAKECNFFLLVQKNTTNEVNCATALQGQFDAYLNTSEHKKLSSILPEYGDFAIVNAIDLYTDNEKRINSSTTKTIPYVKEINLKEKGVYEIVPGQIQETENYMLTPYVLPNNQMVLKYVMESIGVLSDSSIQKGQALRVEGNKILNDKQEEIMSIVNMGANQFFIKTITVSKE